MFTPHEFLLELFTFLPNFQQGLPWNNSMLSRVQKKYKTWKQQEDSKPQQSRRSVQSKWDKSRGKAGRGVPHWQESKWLRMEGEFVSLLNAGKRTQTNSKELWRMETSPPILLTVLPKLLWLPKTSPTTWPFDSSEAESIINSRNTNSNKTNPGVSEWRVSDRQLTPGEVKTSRGQVGRSWRRSAWNSGSHCRLSRRSDNIRTHSCFLAHEGSSLGDVMNANA